MAVQSVLLPDEKIFEANEIARAEWRTDSVWIQRIVAILVNNIQPTDKEFTSAIIPIHELISSKGGSGYLSIRSLLSELVTQHVIIKTPGSPKGLMAFNIFAGSAIYHDKKNALEVCLNPALRPYYLELRKRFVAYGLTEFLSLPGTYHQALYKYLKSWENEGKHGVDIAELHRILGSSKTSKKNYAAFDDKVLKPAHKFINERTSLKYSYEPQRFGRGGKVVSIIFTFQSKPKYKKAPPAKTPKTKPVKTKR